MNLDRESMSYINVERLQVKAGLHVARSCIAPGVEAFVRPSG